MNYKMMNILWCTDKLLSGDSVNIHHFLASGSVNTLPLLGSKFLIMQQWATTLEHVSTWSVPRSYPEDNWGDPVSSVEFCMGGCKERT
jgi:hypothetical protein